MTRVFSYLAATLLVAAALASGAQAETVLHIPYYKTAPFAPYVTEETHQQKQAAPSGRLRRSVHRKRHR
jgi:hypothetical protein